jgi:hypothetical protein
MNKVKKFCKELKYSFGVNSWYMKIQVKKGSENTADVLIDHRYNTIELTLYDAFFLATPEFQADTLIHEFCHLFNSPVFNLLNEQNAGKLVTQYHAEDILEQANARAERTIVYILNNRDLAKAYREYITPEKKLRSVKRSPKMPQKVIKKKTGTR